MGKYALRVDLIVGADTRPRLTRGIFSDVVGRLICLVLTVKVFLFGGRALGGQVRIDQWDALASLARFESILSFAGGTATCRATVSLAASDFSVSGEGFRFVEAGLEVAESFCNLRAATTRAFTSGGIFVRRITRGGGGDDLLCGLLALVAGAGGGIDVGGGVTRANALSDMLVSLAVTPRDRAERRRVDMPDCFDSMVGTSNRSFLRLYFGSATGRIILRKIIATF